MTLPEWLDPATLRWVGSEIDKETAERAQVGLVCDSQEVAITRCKSLSFRFKNIATRVENRRKLHKWELCKHDVLRSDCSGCRRKREGNA